MSFSMTSLLEALCARIGCRVELRMDHSTDTFMVRYPLAPIERAVDYAWELNR